MLTLNLFQFVNVFYFPSSLYNRWNVLSSVNDLVIIHFFLLINSPNAFANYLPRLHWNCFTLTFSFEHDNNTVPSHFYKVYIIFIFLIYARLDEYSLSLFHFVCPFFFHNNIHNNISRIYDIFFSVYATVLVGAAICNFFEGFDNIIYLKDFASFIT